MLRQVSINRSNHDIGMVSALEYTDFMGDVLKVDMSRKGYVLVRVNDGLGVSIPYSALAEMVGHLGKVREQEKE